MVPPEELAFFPWSSLALTLGSSGLISFSFLNKETLEPKHHRWACTLGFWSFSGSLLLQPCFCWVKLNEEQPDPWIKTSPGSQAPDSIRALSTSGFPAQGRSRPVWKSLCQGTLLGCPKKRGLCRGLGSLSPEVPARPGSSPIPP